MSTGVKQQLKADAELMASDERFAERFQSTLQPMSIKALSDGRYMDVNDSFLIMSGYARDELVGRTTASSSAWAEPESLNNLVDQLNRRGTIHNCETRFRTKCGQLRTLLSSIELINYRGESCMLIASSDVTERNELEEQARQNRRRFVTLVDNSDSLIWCLDRDLHLTFASSSLERAVGLSEKEILGLTLRDLPKRVADWKKVEHLSSEVLQTGLAVSLDFVYNGRNRRLRVIPERGRDDDDEALMCIDEDITEQVRSEDELLRLTVRLFNMQDEERRRIARELHDGMAQNLFAITINLARLQQHHSISLIPEVTEALVDCQALCEQSLQEIRTLSYLLHPPLLDQAGLFSALQWYVEGFTRRTGIYVDLVELQDIGRLPSDIETALFRVVQECLTNICRHSGSDTACIRLEKHPDGVLLRIRDQGHGMAINGELSSEDHIGDMGVGIPGMRQRLKQLGGRLEITSGDHGTTIVAKVPVHVGAQNDNNSAG